MPLICQKQTLPTGLSVSSNEVPALPIGVQALDPRNVLARVLHAYVGSHHENLTNF